MFRALVAFVLIGSGSLPAQGDTLAGPIPAEVIRIIDGDTIKVRATIWLNQTIVVSVRLRGIDAPELFRPKCPAEKTLARAAKASVATVTPVGSQVWLSEISRDKYGGRVVATVTTPGGQILSTHLLAHGQAIIMGGAKPWCEAS